MIIKRLGGLRARKIVRKRAGYGSKEVHELLLFKTPQHTYCYVIDLKSFKVLFSVSTLSLRKSAKEGRLKGFDEMQGIGLASLVGKEVADRCKKQGINPVINVAQYKYHGRVKALVESFRSIVNS